MTLRRTLKSLTLSVLILSGAAAAQLPQVKQESDEEKAKARKELERKALALLDETLEQSQVLKLAENRAAVRLQAADLLWPRDEKRARQLFRDAASDFLAARTSARDAEARSRPDRSYWSLMQLRSQLLSTVAARDAQFALELLRDTRPPSSDAGGGSDAYSGMYYEDPEQELRLEQSLMAQAAESDPKAALRLAEESLSKGVTFGVLQVLERLRRKDADSASKLAGEIVAKLRGQNLTGGQESFSVAVALLQSVVMPQSAERTFYYGGTATKTAAAEKPKPLALEESDVRDLADLVAGAALKDSTANGAYGLLMAVRPLLPELEKRVPARAAQLRQRIAEVDKTLDPRMKAWAQMNSLMTKTPDAIIEEAAKMPEEVRPAFYAAAASKLAEAGETEKARQVVNDNLRGEAREQWLALLDQTELARAVEKGDTERARGVVSSIKSKEKRARALAELAVMLAAKGDRKGAGQLLEEARGLLDRQPDDEKEIEALLEVARGYALVEPAKTFEMIEPLIDQGNDMIAAAALLEKFGQGSGFFRKGEMLMTPGLSMAGGSYARYVKALAELARVDFDRTRATADRFNRDETRLIARLLIARSILSDRPDAPANDRNITYAGGGFMFSQ
ncbi:MAG TPA: hypothetical protein VJ866_12030 [Pyrinomonadaceae bacterium]|nr:hypothetical protein [Pyrinomonadaceae bacterium]